MAEMGTEPDPELDSESKIWRLPDRSQSLSFRSWIWFRSQFFWLRPSLDGHRDGSGFGVKSFWL